MMLHRFVLAKPGSLYARKSSLKAIFVRRNASLFARAQFDDITQSVNGKGSERTADFPTPLSVTVITASRSLQRDHLRILNRCIPMATSLAGTLCLAADIGDRSFSQTCVTVQLPSSLAMKRD